MDEAAAPATGRNVHVQGSDSTVKTGAPGFGAARQGRLEWQLKGLPFSTDSKPWTRTLRPGRSHIHMD
eukprot:3096219-Alexandrium_andersonii.AAC.1